MSGAIEHVSGIVGWAEWLRTGGMLGALGLAVKLYLDNRKLRIDEDKSDREGWGELIRALREEVASVRQQQKDERLDCERRLNTMQQQIDGMRKEIAARDAAIVRTLGPDTAAGRSALDAAAKQQQNR